MKKILMVTTVALLMTGCSTTTLKNFNRFQSGEISENVLEFVADKRQDILETKPSKKPYYWNKDGIQGMMYIVSTWQKADGMYCRRMYERFYSGFKEAELYNEWCRIDEKKWAVNVR